MARCTNKGRGRGSRCPKADKVANDIVTLHEKEAKAEIAQLLEDDPTQIMPCLAALRNKLLAIKLPDEKAWVAGDVHAI